MREAGWRFTAVVAVVLFMAGCRSGRPATEAGLAWSYGGGLDRVVSGPSRDAAGNLHFMVVRGSDDLTRHEGIFLVTVDAQGQERRRTKVTDARRESPANPWNRWALRSPVLGGDGSAWLIHAGEVVRIDPAGNIRWRVAFPHAHLMPEGNTFRRPDLGGAVGPDGVLFVTTPSFVMALSPDGRWLWTTVRAPRPGPERSLATRSNGAPVMGRDGSVIATCAACVEDRPRDSGIAAFDPKTGARRWFVGVTGMEPRFGTPAVGEDGTVFDLLAFGLGPMQLVAATADGQASSTRFPMLGTGDGPVTPVIGAAGRLALPVGPRVWFVDRTTGEGRSVELGANVVNAVGAGGRLWALVQADSQNRSRGRLVSMAWDGPDVQPLATPTLAAAMGFQIEAGTLYAVAEDGRLIAVHTAR